MVGKRKGIHEKASLLVIVGFIISHPARLVNSVGGKSTFLY
jgi:hypothetical protein